MRSDQEFLRQRVNRDYNENRKLTVFTKSRFLDPQRTKKVGRSFLTPKLKRKVTCRNKKQ